MGDFDPAFIHTLAVQSWSMYGVGMFLILLRLYARIHRLGFKGLQADDYIMVFAGCLYTILVSCLNVISENGGSNLYPPEKFSTFSPENIQQRIHGSKIVIVSEQAMLNVIYSIKACMLIMYTRLTINHSSQRNVKYLACYVAVGWIATEIAFFTTCRPFKGYWAMPPPNPQCSTLEHYAIVQACFNISSDTLMLFIPLPLVTRLNVPWKQKLVLCVIFSMGTFVILAAILTKVFNLSNIWDPSYMLWYTRESSVAVYVSNLPLIWPLLREWFPLLRRFTPGNKTTSRDKQNGYGLSSGTGRPRTTIIAGRHISGGYGGRRLSEHEHKNGVTTTIRGKGDSADELSSISLPDGDDIEMGRIRKNDSEERLRDDKGGWDLENSMGGIHKSTTVTVQISEEHIENPGIVMPMPTKGAGSRVKEVGMDEAGGGRKEFKWDFEKRR